MASVGLDEGGHTIAQHVQRGVDVCHFFLHISLRIASLAKRWSPLFRSECNEMRMLRVQKGVVGWKQVDSRH